MVSSLIDDNKFVSQFINRTYSMLIVLKVPLLGLLAGFMICKAKETEWSIHKLSTGTQLVFKIVVLLAALLILVCEYVTILKLRVYC